MATRGAAQSVSLLKRAWHEVPDLVLSCSLGIAGAFLTAFIVVKRYNTFEEDHKHRFKYTVVRREDVTDPSKIGKIYN